jgi:hypothetical protein
MGDFEREVFAQRGLERTKLVAWLKTRLEELIAKVAEELGPTEKGLGFSLPSSAEIVELSDKVADLLKEVPEPGSLIAPERLVHVKLFLANVLRSVFLRLPVPLRQRFSKGSERLDSIVNHAMRLIDKTPCDPFREGLARLFGASLKLVVRKRGQPVATVGGRLKGSFPESDGVILGFEAYILKLLGQDHASIPDLQTAAPDKIQQVFPAPEWRLETSPDGIRTIISTQAVAPMRLGLPRGPALIVFRVYAARINSPYRLILSLGGQELARQNVYQSEAFLLAGVSDSAAGSAELAIRAIPLDDIEPSALNTHFAFTYAGVLNL